MLIYAALTTSGAAENIQPLAVSRTICICNTPSIPDQIDLIKYDRKPYRSCSIVTCHRYSGLKTE